MSPVRQPDRLRATGQPASRGDDELLDRREELPEQRSVRVAEPAAAPARSLFELVLVDRHEAQGWRARRDERLDHLFEDSCDWVHTYGAPGQFAVDSDELSLTYGELDARANQVARYLRLHGAGAGDRIGLLFDRPADSYVAMLAVLKIGAAYVPMDVSFPADRMAYIVEDAQVRTVLTMSHVNDRVRRIELLTASGTELVQLDKAAPLIDEQNSRRLIDAERGILDNQLAYIIYTPEADGRPRGVAVDHPSICNFVKAAAEVYGIRPRDRVYQGLPLAFDFSIQETWLPWFRGATVVPKPAGATLVGQDLHQFLTKHRVTAMCTIPSLLATIEDDLPGLRFLLVSGEACPPDLIARWHKPGRRFVNAYGPSEATVTTAWTELHPGEPTTLGVPLPTYNTVILDVQDPYRALPHGEIGEIGIAGIGLARGYVNRDDLTESAFIPDFLGIPGNPSGRIYRTGDLGRVTIDEELEYHGRVDPTANRRGYRSDLAEIEAALLRVPGIAQALSDLVEAPPRPDSPPDPMPATELELAAVLAEVLDVQQVSVDSHFFTDLGADSMLMARFCARVRKRDDLPSVSMKDIYAHSTIRSLATAFAVPALAEQVAARAELELATVLAEVLDVERVSVDGHFFTDLGADSMVMARFCARARKRADLPSVSMKDVYAHSTIRSLATALAPPALTTSAPSAAPLAASSTASTSAPTPPPTEVPTAAGTPWYVLCGTLQLLLFLGYSYLAAYGAIRGYEWIAEATGLLHIYLRALVFGGVGFAGMCTLPIVAKWLLIGRWKPQQIPLWSPAYLRFWIVKTLIRSSPLARFAGSPLYVLYLRALGAKIGRGATIFSPTMPVCTDLLTIGAGTVIRKDSSFTCYRAHAGVIQTGPVSLGKDVFVGEATVLDIGTSMGDGAQLGHTSSLHTGQAVPAGEHWHGSPAQRTAVEYRMPGSSPRRSPRRILFPVLQLLNLLVVATPLLVGGAFLVFAAVPGLVALLQPQPLALTSLKFYAEALTASYLLFFGAVLVGLLVVATVPRLLSLAIKPNKVYPLYGFHYWLHRTIARMTNVKFFTDLFGDSSYIVGYLRWLGYGLFRVVQTGSNFGMAVKHETPYLSSIGSGTVIADGLSMINAEFSSTSFRVTPVSIGANNFLGNYIAYPSGGRTGDNCLLGTKVMVPLDGKVRQGVGLLGSPSFEIPRSVERDNRLDVQSPDELRRRVAAKAAHNVVTIGLYLVVRWIYLFMVTLLTLIGADLYDSLDAPVVALVSVLTALMTVIYFVLVDRAFRGLMALLPSGRSIYDRAFWRHERFWKVVVTDYIQIFNGTPFKNMIWRLLGVRVGRRVFDDGCYLPERSFVTIGDGCTLNAGSKIWCHSQEDGAFKSDRITVGNGCTLGVGAFIHYGVTMGDGAIIAPDSFLMKGEEVPEREWWGGNPASKMRTSTPRTARDNNTRDISPVAEWGGGRRRGAELRRREAESRRVRGLDLARGIAVLGMFAAHLGPAPDQPSGQLLSIFHGRSAALFLFLAGVSLALISGGVRRADGPTLRRSRIKIAARAGVLLVLGLSLTSLVADIEVILPVYAVLFVLALPLLRARPRTLILLAGTLAIGGPVLSYLIRGFLKLTPASTPPAPGLSAATSWNSLVDGIVSVVLNGAYPVLTVLPITLVGLSVGRLDLSARSVQRRLLGVGAVLSAVGYGGSALAVHFGGLATIIGSGSIANGQQQLHDVAVAESGTVPTTSWAWLLTAGPHSGTPMEILGAGGCALAVLGLALIIGNRAHWVFHPVLAVGTMPLTAYTGHLLAVWAFGTGEDNGQKWLLLAATTAATMTVAVIWLRYFQSGPLEAGLRTIASAAAKRSGRVRRSL